MGMVRAEPQLNNCDIHPLATKPQVNGIDISRPPRISLTRDCPETTLNDSGRPALGIRKTVQNPLVTQHAHFYTEQ